MARTRKPKFVAKCSRVGCESNAMTRIVDERGKQHQVCRQCWELWMDRKDGLVKKEAAPIDWKTRAAGADA
jgi:hypothetical protein